MRDPARNSAVVLAKARTHYPREEFGEGPSFGTKTDHNREITRYGSWLSPGRRWGFNPPRATAMRLRSWTN